MKDIGRRVAVAGGKRAGEVAPEPANCLIPDFDDAVFPSNGRMRYGPGSDGSVRPTEAIRRAIHDSRASPRALSKRYGINQKTVAKWKKRVSVADLPTGPKERILDKGDRRGAEIK
jgi:hypothetical protein